MIRRMSWIGLVGLLVLAVPQLGLAGAKPVYSYVELGYNDVNVDNLGGVDDEGNGGFAGVSIGFFKNFHAFGRYTSTNTDINDADITNTILGVGWHGLLGEKADLIVELSYMDREFDAGVKIDDNGYFGRVGARWRPIKLVEIGGWVRYQDLGDLDSGTVFEANAMVHLWRIPIGLAAEVEDDIETYSAFARFNFGG